MKVFLSFLLFVWSSLVVEALMAGPHKAFRRGSSDNMKRGYARQDGTEFIVQRSKPKKRMDNLFRRHLMTSRRKWHNDKASAMRLDNELKRMERLYYRPDEEPHKEGIKYSYIGPVMEPDVLCYLSVIEAYNDASMGEAGARHATAVLERLHSHLNLNETDKLQPTNVLYTGVVKAWAQAGRADEAKKWLESLEQIYEESQNVRLAPDQVTYSIYLRGLANSNQLSPQETADEAFRIIRRMDHLVETKQNPKATVNAYTLNEAIKCVARLNDYTLIKDIVDDAKRRYEEKRLADMKPEVHLYYTAILRITACNRQCIEPALEAENLVRDMWREYNRTGDPRTRPNSYVYSALIAAYANVRTRRHALMASQRVDVLLDEISRDEMLAHNPDVYLNAMLVKSNKFNPNGGNEAARVLRRMPNPDTRAYQAAIVARASRGEVKRMQMLLDELEARQAANPGWGRINIVTLSTCANAFLKQNMIVEADDIARKMISIYNNTYLSRRERAMDLSVLPAVARLWRHSKDPSAGERIESLIKLMDEAYQSSRFRQIAPSKVMFRDAFLSWRECPMVPNHGRRALDLLEYMEDAPRRGYSIMSTGSELATVLQCIINNKQESLTETMHDLYLRLCRCQFTGDTSYVPQPKTTTYFLKEFVDANDKTAGERAELFLRHIVKISQIGGLGYLKPHPITYNCVVHRLTSEGSLQRAEGLYDYMIENHVYPDERTYQSIITGLVASKDEEEYQRSKMYVHRFMNECHKFGTPDGVCSYFRAFLVAYAKRNHPNDKDLPDLGLKMLETMRRMGLVPRVVDYEVVFHLWLRYGHKNNLVLDLVYMAERLADEGKEPPLGKDFYAKAIGVLMSYSPGTENNLGLGLLKHLQQRTKDGKCDFMVDRQLYHLVLAEWARSGDPKALEAAIKLQEEMSGFKEDSIKPNGRTFGWIIFAAANARDLTQTQKELRLRMATNIFTDVHRLGTTGPSPFTYSSYLAACLLLHDDETSQETMARKVFQVCIQRGLYGTAVHRILSARFPHILTEEAGRAVTDESSIPPLWRLRLRDNKADGSLENEIEILFSKNKQLGGGETNKDDDDDSQKEPKLY